MLDAQGVAPYLMRLSQVCDDLVVIEDNILESELVRTTLKGFSEE